MHSLPTFGIIWYLRYCLRRRRSVGEVLKINPFKIIRLLNTANKIKLILSLGWGGGAAKYIERRISALPTEVLVLIVYPTKKQKVLSVVMIQAGVEVARFNVSSLSAFKLLKGRCEELIVNHLIGWHANFGKGKLSIGKLVQLIDSIIETKIVLGVKLRFMVHDYFSVCPRFALINENGLYCDSEYDKRHCAECLNSREGRIIDFDDGLQIDQWREPFCRLLRACEEVRTFSEDSYSRMQQIYPDAKLTLIPHSPISQHEKITSSCADSVIIGIIGNITIPKGALQVLALAKYLLSVKSPSTKIVVVGKLKVPEGEVVPSCIEVLGPYQQDELGKIVKAYKINMVFFPSVCPETFSYVVQEVMQLGLPIVCFNVGAPKDRVAKYSQGRIIPRITPESALETILALQIKIKTKAKD